MRWINLNQNTRRFFTLCLNGHLYQNPSLFSLVSANKHHLGGHSYEKGQVRVLVENTEKILFTGCGSHFGPRSFLYGSPPRGVIKMSQILLSIIVLKLRIHKNNFK